MQTKNKDPVADGLGAFFRGLGRVLKNAFYGMRKLNRPLNIGGLLLFLLAAFLAYRWQEAIFALEHIGSRAFPLPLRYVLYGALLCSPVLYLAALGSAGSVKAGKYEALFAEVQFMGKDKKYPILTAEQKEGKKTTYFFLSHIPLGVWKKEKELLETIFDCSIRKIEQGKNKKTVRLVTVSSDFKIPENIPWSDEHMSDSDSVLVVGESDLAQVSFDLNSVPHVLSAGETGSGKSVQLRCMLMQMLRKGCQAYMIDFKGGVEFGLAYEQYGEVIMDRARALEVLEHLVQENEERLKLFRSLRVKNLPEYNRKTGSNLCRIILAIDEIGEMLDSKGASKEDKAIYAQLEGALSSIARLGRAAGINMLLGVQRPDANVLTGQIKNNVPVRLSGRFADDSASKIVLGTTEATELPEIKGRFLYKVGNESIEYQAYHFEDDKHLNNIEPASSEMLTVGLVPPMPAAPAPALKKPHSRPASTAASAAEAKSEPNLDFNFDDFEEDIDF